jgi:hypothetical protein
VRSLWPNGRLHDRARSEIPYPLRRSIFASLPGNEFRAGYRALFPSKDPPAQRGEIWIGFVRGLRRQQPANQFLAFVKLDLLALIQPGFNLPEVIAQLADGRFAHDVMHFSIT